MTFRLKKNEWQYDTVRDYEIDYETTQKIHTGDKFITVNVVHRGGWTETRTYSISVCETLFDPLMYLFSKYTMQEIEEIHKGLQRHLAPPTSARVAGVQDKNGQYVVLVIETRHGADGIEYVTVQKDNTTGDVLAAAKRLYSFKIVSNNRHSWQVRLTYQIQDDLYPDEIVTFHSSKEWNIFVRCVGDKAINMATTKNTRTTQQSSQVQCNLATSNPYVVQ
tara:strand:- start:4573 stop:5235 length:663 start_codon:yes stop_codon:yes gene_type:complete